MPLQLSPTTATHAPLELEAVTPERVRSLSLAEIERLPVWHGNQQAPLADFFRVGGDPGDEMIEITGNAAGVHRLGVQMKQGTIHVHGSIGRHAGAAMRGGRLIVEGDACDWLGAEMRAGVIEVRGHAGDLVGAAYRGSPRGMRGGTILVHGNVGHESAHTMRRGLIAVGGACGDHAAINMLAGSLLVFGVCGRRPGAGMRRGTLALLGGAPTLLPTFRRVGRVRPQFMRLALASLRRHGLPVRNELFELDYLLHRGDLLSLARGEILTPA